MRGFEPFCALIVLITAHRPSVVRHVGAASVPTVSGAVYYPHFPSRHGQIATSIRHTFYRRCRTRLRSPVVRNVCTTRLLGNCSDALSIPVLHEIERQAMWVTSVLKQAMRK
ncbi:hypothetical protein J6590_002757 [Homalodisca vitripennis]|nr:hypothetical protein J6590_002757 [Homalodisca vitripennis]